jgi:hypothetical protein
LKWKRSWRAKLKNGQRRTKSVVRLTEEAATNRELKRGQGLPGERVAALEPEDRALRDQMTEGKNVPEVQAQNEKTKRNPLRTKGAIVKRINELRAQIAEKKAALPPTKKQALLEKKQAYLNDLEEKYAATKPAAERAVLADKIDEATQQLRRIEAMPDNERQMYPGQAADEAELAKLVGNAEIPGQLD